jgi:hypothetical protein
VIEQGITVRTGAHSLRNSLFAILQNRKDEISPRMIDLIVDLYEDWMPRGDRIATITDVIEIISKREVNCQLPMSVLGIGPIISTAMMAAIGTSEAFGRGSPRQQPGFPKSQARAGLSACTVVESGIVPVVELGMVEKAGVDGGLGAGLYRPPVAPFAEACAALDG